MGFFSWLGAQFSSGANLPSGADLANLDPHSPRPDRPGEYGSFRSVPQLHFSELPFTDPDRAAVWEQALVQLLDRRKTASKHLRKALETHGKLRQLDAGDNAAYYRAMGIDAQSGAETTLAAGEYTEQLHKLRGTYARIEHQLKAAESQAQKEIQQFNQSQSTFMDIFKGG